MSATRHLNTSDPRFARLTRHSTAAFERASVDEKARTVSVSFASEAPVERWFGSEVLECTEAACDLSRLRAGGAVLVEHNRGDQVGVVDSATVDPVAKRGRAVLRFGQSERAKEIFRDIVDGIRSLISVGYVVRDAVLSEKHDDRETYRVTNWQPFEISMVSVPADPSVGVGRSAIIQTKLPAMPPATANDAAGTATATAPAIPNLDPAQVREINATARAMVQRYPQHAEAIRAIAEKAIESGSSARDFNASLASDVFRTAPLAAITQDPNAARAGLSSKEIKRYSILRAIRLIAENKPIDGLEREASDQVAKQIGQEARGFFLPEEIAFNRREMSRTMLATSPADGGFTVSEDMLAAEFIELLRNEAKVIRLGARVISGLRGDVTIPRQLTGAAAYWVSETGTITNSGATFGQVTAKPRRVGTNVPYSKQFVAQTSLSADALVVADSDAAIATELDRVAIRGSGGSEPLGIVNLGSGALATGVTFGAAPTWAKYLEFLAAVAAQNTATGRLGYLTTPASWVKGMSVARFSGGDTGIIDSNSRVGPFPAEWSNNVASDKVIFGDWSQVLFLEWAGRDVVVDPYSAKKDGNIEVCIQRLVDVVTRRAKAFSISSDSGAQ